MSKKVIKILSIASVLITISGIPVKSSASNSSIKNRFSSLSSLFRNKKPSVTEEPLYVEANPVIKSSVLEKATATAPTGAANALKTIPQKKISVLGTPLPKLPTEVHSYEYQAMAPASPNSKSPVESLYGVTFHFSKVTDTAKKTFDIYESIKEISYTKNKNAVQQETRKSQYILHESNV